MRVGNEFKVRRLSFAKDRRKRIAHGRRTKTKARNAGGRHLKSVVQGLEKDISLEATLRAAAPYQRVRGRKDILIIEKDDFRYKRRERRTSHLMLFVVDGSGSMGAKERMTETKGAINSLLMDCYQKRDQVAMICFRKNEARLLLPPTSSVELAARQLADLPVGGKTPLAHGLVEAFKLVRRHKIKKPETRFIITLITDGRANQSLAGGKIQEEIDRTLRLMAGLEGCDYIVVDTENKSNFLKRDLAPQLASGLGAAYYTIEALKAESLSAIIQSSLAV
jgi:magnesium chelatase subunit D